MPSAARMLAALAVDEGKLVHYETLCDRMSGAGYTYTSDYEVRNYVRHAKNALRSINSTAEIINYSGMGYTLKGWT
jgi:DNA-binding response OmpR family regulator